MAKRISLILLVLALLTVTTGLVFANPCDPADPACNIATGTIEFTSGGLHVLAQNFTIVGSALTGQDLTYVYTNPTEDTGIWTVSDQTGTGSGWHVNIKATPFRKASGRDWLDPVSYFRAQVLPANLELFDEVVDPVDVNESGDPSVDANFQTWNSLSETDARLLYAPDYDTKGWGMGTYHFYPDFSLYVPAETYAGIYTSTVTVTITSGPGE
jgi:hypothetical protein